MLFYYCLFKQLFRLKYLCKVYQVVVIVEGFHVFIRNYPLYFFCNNCMHFTIAKIFKNVLCLVVVLSNKHILFKYTKHAAVFTEIYSNTI